MLEMDDVIDVTLVGHSYGDLVICGATERDWKRIRRLVYLVLVPRHGQSGFDLNSPQFPERFEQDARDNGDGYKGAALVDILGSTDVADLEWVGARLLGEVIAPCPSSLVLGNAAPKKARCGNAVLSST